MDHQGDDNGAASGPAVPSSSPASPFPPAPTPGQVTTPATGGGAPDPGPTAPVWRTGADPYAGAWTSSLAPGSRPPGVAPAGEWGSSPPKPPTSPPPRHWAQHWVVVAVVAAVVGGGAGAGIAEALGTGNGATSTPTVRVGTVTPGPALAGGAQIPPS